MLRHPALLALHLVILWSVIAGFLVGCVETRADSTLQRQMRTVDGHYAEARAALLRHLETAPDEQREAWLVLIARADSLREQIRCQAERLETAFPDDVSAIYDSAAQLYAEARTQALADGIKPQPLLHLDEELQGLAQAYAAWQRDPITRTRSKIYLHAGELGRLALTLWGK